MKLQLSGQSFQSCFFHLVSLSKFKQNASISNAKKQLQSRKNPNSSVRYCVAADHTKVPSFNFAFAKGVLLRTEHLSFAYR